MDANPIKLGLIAELTGPLSFMGIVNANLTTMLVDDINEQGGGSRQGRVGARRWFPGSTTSG